MAGMGMRRRGPNKSFGKAKKGTLKRLLKFLYDEYKGFLVVIGICIVLSAIGGSVGGLFLNKIYASIGEFLEGTLNA